MVVPTAPGELLLMEGRGAKGTAAGMAKNQEGEAVVLTLTTM